MECPKCQFENPDGITFCGECGTKLERKCPRCSSMNPAQLNSLMKKDKHQRQSLGG